MKVVTIVGARPQFIKAAAVSRVLRAGPGIEEVLVHTGQHYDKNMSDVFFEELEIPQPDHNLGVGSGSHAVQTGRMLEAVERVLMDLCCGQEAARPDWLLVYGDTNSTLAGALAAAKLHVPVAHVEAGLRSFNRRMPEEINRVLTDHVSDLLFAPTRLAVENLRKEGIPESRVHLVGDVMYDTVRYYGARAKASSRVLKRLGLSPKGYILATVHRAENTDETNRLKAIVSGLSRAVFMKKLPVVFPLHPRTRHFLERHSLLEDARRALRLVEPLAYLDMVMLEQNARLIVTDSGGVQKEAFFHQVPCVTLREETEWVELIELGWNRLVPPESAASVAEGIGRALNVRGKAATPYGDGKAAERIAAILQD